MPRIQRLFVVNAGNGVRSVLSKRTDNDNLPFATGG